MYREPEMVCSKCGFTKRVTRSPEATRAWFKKYHKGCGLPIYSCEVGPFTAAEGQIN